MKQASKPGEWDEGVREILYWVKTNNFCVGLLICRQHLFNPFKYCWPSSGSTGWSGCYAGWLWAKGRRDAGQFASQLSSPSLRGNWSHHQIVEFCLTLLTVAEIINTANAWLWTLKHNSIIVDECFDAGIMCMPEIFLKRMHENQQDCFYFMLFVTHHIEIAAPGNFNAEHVVEPIILYSCCCSCIKIEPTACPVKCTESSHYSFHLAARTLHGPGCEETLLAWSEHTLVLASSQVCLRLKLALR